MYFCGFPVLVEPPLTKKGQPCQPCSRAIARYGRLCHRHMEPRERERHRREAARTREFLAQKKRDYDNQRRPLNAKNRQRLLGEREARCEACGGGAPVDVDHIVPVTEFMDRGEPMEAADEDWNLWFLCKPCHSVKTHPPRCPRRIPMGRPPRWYWGRRAEDVSQLLRWGWRRYDGNRMRLLNVLVRQEARIRGAGESTWWKVEQLLETPAEDPAVGLAVPVGEAGHGTLRNRLKWDEWWLRSRRGHGAGSPHAAVEGQARAGAAGTHAARARTCSR